MFSGMTYVLVLLLASGTQEIHGLKYSECMEQGIAWQDQHRGEDAHWRCHEEGLPASPR